MGIISNLLINFIITFFVYFLIVFPIEYYLGERKMLIFKNKVWLNDLFHLFDSVLVSALTVFLISHSHDYKFFLLNLSETAKEIYRFSPVQFS